jgi:hypothetical protein
MHVDEARQEDTKHLAKYFEYDHLPEHLQVISGDCSVLGERMVDRLPDGLELTAGLRKLLEAKDCFVRAALDVHKES